MRNDYGRITVRTHQGWGAARVYLSALALLMGVVGGVMLLAAALALGPEDEVSIHWWTGPLVLAAAGATSVISGRASWIQMGLVVTGACLIVAAGIFMVEDLSLEPAPTVIVFYGVPVVLGLLAIALAWRDRRIEDPRLATMGDTLT